MRRNRGLWVEVLLGLMALAAIVGAVMVYKGVLALETQAREREAYIAALEERLHDGTQTATGGAESRAPAPQPTSADWTFPIAESDYLMLTSPFGYRVSPILDVELYHEGVDIAATWRAQVVAVADGTVVEHWPPPDGFYRGHAVYGGLVVVEHEAGWRSLYAHLSSTRVNTGQRVRAGEVIGRVGGTGQSRGEHLHLELRKPDGSIANPALYITVDME